MKNKSLKLGLSYFFRQRIHGKDTSDYISELVRPESEWEETENTIRDILRWADDGGKMLELRSQKDRSNLDAARARAKE
jgi:hypothetical protein